MKTKLFNKIAILLMLPLCVALAGCGDDCKCTDCKCGICDCKNCKCECCNTTTPEPDPEPDPVDVLTSSYTVNLNITADLLSFVQPIVTIEKDGITQEIKISDDDFEVDRFDSEDNTPIQYKWSRTYETDYWDYTVKASVRYETREGLEPCYGGGFNFGEYLDISGYTDKNGRTVARKTSPSYIIQNITMILAIDINVGEGDGSEKQKDPDRVVNYIKEHFPGHSTTLTVDGEGKMTIE